MTKYEVLLLLDPELDDARQGEIVDRVRELVEKGDGSWDLHDAWGRRRLAYEIGHKAEGSYHLLHFTSDAPTLDEVSRVLRIHDGVMRHMATRRIEGSPARPVAISAPVRQDVGRQERGSEERGSEDAVQEAPVAAPETEASAAEDATAEHAEVADAVVEDEAVEDEAVEDEAVEDEAVEVAASVEAEEEEE